MTETRALREIYGEVLVKAGKKYPDIVVLDADMAKGTFTNFFAKQFPDRFYNFGIAEQNMMVAAAGFSTTGYIPFVNSYAMFCVMRCCEQVRTSIAYPKLNVKIAGGHGGMSAGPDGVTHQATEDIAVMRAIPNMVVLAPADPMEVEQVVRAAIEYNGPVYIRLVRAKVRPFLPEDYEFKIGESRVLMDGDEVTLLGTGVMVYECMKSAEKLRKEGISARVINVSSIKPIDKQIIIRAAEETGAILTVEDHNIIGGLGGAVAEVLVENKPVPMERIGLRDTFGQSGSEKDLFKYYSMSVDDIVGAAKKILQRKGK